VEATAVVITSASSLFLEGQRAHCTIPSLLHRPLPIRFRLHRNLSLAQDDEPWSGMNSYVIDALKQARADGMSLQRFQEIRRERNVHTRVLLPGAA
jgi:hypothetical protein